MREEEKPKSWERWMWEKDVANINNQIKFHQKELRSYKATLHIMKDFNNWRQTMKSMKQFDDGKTVTIDLKDLIKGREDE